MNKVTNQPDDVDTRLNNVMADLLEADPATLTDEMNATQLPLWDSVNHLRLITAVEEEFDVMFSMAEVESIDCIGRLRTLVREKV